MTANMMSPDGILPIPVQQAAASQQLGAFTKYYPPALVKSIIGAIICAAVAVMFMFIGTQADDGAVVFVLIGIFFFGFTAYLIYQIVQASGQKIYLFQQGIIIENNGQIQVFPWNQASEVFQSITRHYRNGIYTGTTYQYTLCRADGYKVKLNNMTKGIAELGQAVAQGVTQELVPRAMHSIHSGQTLTFAQFTINTQGIGNGREFIPWQQVQAVDVNQGQVSVKKAGKFFNWGSAAVSKIPNFFVFLAVSQEMIRQTNASGQPGYGAPR
jgi:hypothetical protein